MCKAHFCVTVKNTFIAINPFEEEEEDTQAMYVSDLRKRATTADVATLAYDTLHLEDGEEEASSSRPWSAVCPEVIEALEKGALSATELLQQLEGCVKTLALDSAGASLLRAILDHLSLSEARQFAADFRGWVVEAVQHQGSAQVLARLVSILPSRDVAFISQELKGQNLTSYLACTLGGAELLAALFERHWLLQDEVRELSWELMHGSTDIACLCCHKHAYLVILPLICVHCPQYQELVLNALLGNIQRFCRHRYSSQILAHLLTSVTTPHREAIANTVMSAAGAVVALACHGFGHVIIRGMLQVPAAQPRVLQYLQKSRVRISKDKFGAELLQDVGIQVPPQVQTRAAVGGA